MSRLIANHLIARAKLGESPTSCPLAPAGAAVASSMATRSLGGFIEDVFRDLIAMSPAALAGRDRLFSCLLYQSPLPRDSYYIQLAHRERGGRSTASEAPSRLVPGFPLTPRVSLTGWPSWLARLAYLLALTRRSWVYAVLLSSRDPSAGWLGRLLAGCSSNPVADRQPLFDSVRELEHLAWELERGEEALRGACTSPAECFLRDVRDALPGDPNLYADPAAVVQTVLAQPAFTDQGSYPLLTDAVAALRRVDQAALTQALVALCDAVSPGGVTPVGCGRLGAWVDGRPPELSQPAVPPAAAIRRLLGLPLVAGADVVVSLDDRAAWLLGVFPQGTPQAAVLAGILVGCPWHGVVAALRGFLPGPASIPAPRLAQVEVRLGRWRDWATTRTNPDPAAGPAGPDFWLFLDIPSPLWVNPPAAIDVALSTLRAWLGGNIPLPGTWAGVGYGPDELPLRAALASLYLDDLHAELVECYRQHRAVP